LGLTVAGDDEMDLVPVSTTPWAGAAAHAVESDDAAMLGGLPASDYRLAGESVDWADVVGAPVLLGDTICADNQFRAYDEAAGAWSCESGSAEADPQFTASDAAGITAADIGTWTDADGWGDHAGAGYLTEYTETDPVFGASDVAGVTAADIGSWTDAYGWGDHAGAGYLTEYTETDPVFGASDVAGVTAADIGTWTDAYGWGDHGGAGYLTEYTERDPVFGASDVAGVTAADIGTWTDAYGWGDHAGAGYLTEFTEADPVFGASEASSITGTDTGEWDQAYGWGDHAGAGYLTAYTETDPVFGASEASSITGTDTGEWDQAYGWGNHGSVGYLTAYTETDPVFGASEASSITGADTGEWDQAYGWGNHASAGYFSAAGGTISGAVTIDNVLTAQAGNDSSSGITFDENPGGGSGDFARIRYYAVSGEQTRLRLQVGNDDDEEIELNVDGQDVLLLGKHTVGVDGAMVQNGCPSGFSLENGVCWEWDIAWGSQTWNDAQETCHALNSRICTYRDALLGWGPDTDHEILLNNDWLGDFVGDDTVLDVNNNGNKANFEGTRGKGNTQEFACCVTPY